MEGAIHSEVLEQLETALAHFDEHEFLLPAIHLSSAIEALRLHIEDSRACDGLTLDGIAHA